MQLDVVSWQLPQQPPRKTSLKRKITIITIRWFLPTLPYGLRRLNHYWSTKDWWIELRSTF